MRIVLDPRWTVFTLLLTACVSSPVVTSSPLPSGPKITVPGNAIICVPVPPDAVFEGELYPGSGDEIARQIKEGLEAVGRTTQLVKESYSNAKVQCKENGVRLALETRVEHYEDRVTGWSGKPDRIELRLFLFDIDHPDQKRSIYYKATSSLLFSAFFEWGNAKPSALLNDDFTHVLRKLILDDDDLS